MAGTLARRTQGTDHLGDETLNQARNKNTNKRARGFWLVFACLLSSVSLQAQPAPHVRGELISEVSSIAPGDQFDVLFRQDIDPGWHTYWRNPGDSGAPPDFSWQAPEGVVVGEFQYPYPERIPYGPLMNFGYHGEVFLPFSVSVDAAFTGEEVALMGKGRVLVCADICIPQKMELEITIPVGPTIIDESAKSWFQLARAQLPVPLNVSSSVTSQDDQIVLGIGLPGVQDNRISSVEFFPFHPDLIDNPSTQLYQLTEKGLTLQLKPGFGFDVESSDLSGVLVIRESAGGAVVSSYEINLLTGTATHAATGTQSIGLMAAIVFAFLGGLILNLMPCVFPVLSIKILSLVESVRSGSDSIRLHGLAYAAGVVLSFVGIALLLIGLRASGEIIGWGFQLQSPMVVALLAYLFLVIGLNLLGVFEIGFSLMSLGGQGPGHGYLGSVSTGVLATVVAAPCTAPFMGAAVGYALIQSPLTGIIVFAALGAGMALPYLLLCYSPVLLDKLPKPGNWMVILKQFLAFPMFASAIWLLWVLGLQVGATGMMQVLIGGLVIALAIWILNQFSRQGTAGTVGKMIAGLLIVSALYAALVQTPQKLASRNNVSTAGVYSREALAEALKEGPVFVNFTAAWCITCQVNEINALGTSSVKQAFSARGITYLRADWTNEDPEITRALQEYGRSGVPLYLLYQQNGQTANILPQILTESIVLDAISNL